MLENNVSQSFVAVTWTLPEFAKFAIGVEQCDALKAYLIQKRLELASVKSILAPKI